MIVTATTQERPAALASERRGLLLSGVAALVLAAVGVAWGLWVGSQIILFDGFYALIGVGLSWLGLQAAKAIEAGPSERYPFGRETLGPLVVGIQGLVLLGSLGYASLEAVGTILDGGSEVVAASALLYGVTTLILSLVLAWWLQRTGRDSELLLAEAVQWRAGAVLSIVMVVGFGAALVLDVVGPAELGGFVDPALVLVAAAILVPTPARMIRSTLRELLEAAPGPDVAEPVERAIEQVRELHGLPEPTVRLGKLGRKLYIELDFLVEPGRWAVGDADTVRRELTALIDKPGQVLWINVELHTDPHWDI